MPELPEVEICRRNLERWSTGRTVVGVQLPDAGAVRAERSTRVQAARPDGRVAMAALVGGRCGALARHGKRIAWQIGSHGLVLHLGMTGRWLRRSEGDVPRFGRVGLVLDDGATLWLDDSRRFGCVVPMAADALATELSRGLGPDALDARLDGQALSERMRGRGAIKVALMDQARLGGVGNIQAAEALFRAGIHPSTSCAALSARAWDLLAAALHQQLIHTITLTEADEVAYMSDGGVDNPFEVYGRAGQPCRACGATLVGGTHAGRSTCWCPGCQPGEG